MIYSFQLKKMNDMNGEQSTNGNTQINNERASLNNRVSRFRILGQTKKVQWDGRRRNRTI